MKQAEGATLKRELGVFAAMMMGLGSILGTGIFVSFGLAAGIAGPGVVVAIVLAALVAAGNGLSSAQLAAAHPVSGGTYEYGYRFLKPSTGFLAGWMFLLAKSASAATAALGFAGYLLATLQVDGQYQVPVAVLTVALFTGITLAGIRRSSQVNIAVVSVTLLALVSFTVAGLWFQSTPSQLTSFTLSFRGDDTIDSLGRLLHATALMFVGYTGYARIATLAEDVKDPKRTIPRAIIAALIVSASLYLAVSVAAVGAVGSDFLYEATQGRAAPLELAARQMGMPLLPWLVALGAATAMLGVLLNLMLGLTRVALAMGRRRDLPSIFATLNTKAETPGVAVLATGLVIAGLTLFGSVKVTWSFSAFTVLIYYAITNAAALAMPRDLQLFPRWIPVFGLLSCLVLAFWVEVSVWLSGIGLGAVGLAWFAVARAIRHHQPIPGNRRSGPKF